MRVLLVGPAPARAALRVRLASAGIEVVGECASLGAARRSGLSADAVVSAPLSALRGTPALRADARLSFSGGDDLDPVEPLTARELQVAAQLAQGLSNKRIADRLGISAQTVRYHVASICGKLGARNRTDVRRAVRLGLLTLDRMSGRSSTRTGGSAAPSICFGPRRRPPAILWRRESRDVTWAIPFPAVRRVLCALSRAG